MTAVKNGWALVDKSTGAILQEYHGEQTRQLKIPSLDGKQFTWHEPPYDQGGRKIVERWYDGAIPEGERSAGTVIAFNGVRVNITHTTEPLSAEELAAKQKAPLIQELAESDGAIIRGIDELLERVDAIVRGDSDPGVSQQLRDKIARRKELRNLLR